MPSNFGPNVSRVLDPTGTQYTNIIWQEGRPPLDAEFSLGLSMAMNVTQNAVLRGVPSGWLGNETNNTEVFLTDPTWSDWFKFGNQLSSNENYPITWANVNGWLIPVIGTRTGFPPGSYDNQSTWNKIALNPPGGNTASAPVEFAFLEVWLARIPANPSTLNKPDLAHIYQFGNVEGGMSYLPDDLVDSAIGIETTERIQLQYRIRVVSGQINLTLYPDGFDPNYVNAQGATTAPIASTPFVNMRQVLGDPGLWRAGSGDGTTSPLATVDGYVYAIPLTAVFRRNVVAWNGHPNPNLNGGFNRNPTAVDRTGIATFSTVPTLATALAVDTTSSFTLVNATSIPLPLTPASAVTVRIGNELLQYSSIVGTTVTISARGVSGTVPEYHAAGAIVEVVSGRPDGLFADQITKGDILDLRHVVNPNGFDYEALLKSNLDKLLRGQLRSTWKTTGAAGVQGTLVPYQDYISETAPTGLGVTQLDMPDGFRQVWSDAAVPQRILAIAVPNGSTSSVIDVSASWGLSCTVNQTVCSMAATFNPLDVLVIPVAQFKGTVNSQDYDQIRFLYDSDPTTISLRIDGYPGFVPSSWYTVTPATPGPNDDLTITFTSLFPANVVQNIYIEFNLLYGPGRGLSRRPLAINNICYYNPGTTTLTQTEYLIPNNVPVRTAYAPLWAKYTSAVTKGALPVTAEAYADLGSKTVILTPYRKIELPHTAVGSPTAFSTYDGNALWSNPTTVPGGSGTTGFTSYVASTWQFQDTGNTFSTITAGMKLVVANTPATVADGVYSILSVTPGTPGTLTLSSPIGIVGTSTLHYSIQAGATQGGHGLMPTYKRDGVTAKWVLTDPLTVFSGQGDTTPARRNIYAVIPKHLAPTWGEVRVPIFEPAADGPDFYEGVNFLFNSSKGSSFVADEQDYVPYTSFSGNTTYATFTTLNLGPSGGPAPYNGTTSWNGVTLAGMKRFDDTPTGGYSPRGLNRHGLQLPPVYGIARLFAVYAALDYKANSSAYDPGTRNRRTIPPSTTLATKISY